MTVKGCSFSVGDDCVCLKGSKGPFAMQDKDSPPTEHIRVTNCTFKAGHGSVTLGSEATVIRERRRGRLPGHRPRAARPHQGSARYAAGIRRHQLPEHYTFGRRDNLRREALDAVFRFAGSAAAEVSRARDNGV